MDGFSLLISLAAYVLTALGMYAIAQRREIKHPWLAWIPVANMWLLGCISDQYRHVARNQESNKRKLLPILCAVIIVALVVMVFVSVIWAMPIIRELGILEMSPEELVQLMDEDYLEDLTEMVMGYLETNEDYYTHTVRISTVIIACVWILAVVGIWLMVVHYMAYYDLFASCVPDRGSLYLVLSIFLSGLVSAVLVYTCKDKDGGMPSRQADIPQIPTWLPPVDEM